MTPHFALVWKVSKPTMTPPLRSLSYTHAALDHSTHQPLALFHTSFHSSKTTNTTHIQSTTRLNTTNALNHHKHHQ